MDLFIKYELPLYADEYNRVQLKEEGKIMEWESFEDMKNRVEHKHMYKYGMKIRGFSFSTQPKEGFVCREDAEDTRYFGYVVYDRPLTKEECLVYSLDFVSDYCM